MTIAVILFVLALAATAAVLIVKKLVYVCAPNEVLLFAGTRRKLDHRTVGYKLVQGGRGIRMPLLERVHRLDLTNMIIDLRVDGAYSRGGIPLNVEGMANVKVASDEATLANAVERFLGRSRDEIMQTAKETLEGNLRGVLATLTPEEVNDDRVKFAQNLLEEADHDLKKLGLNLDTLKIQNVSDDKGYLDSIGRKQSAALMMRSRIAEAESRAMANERSAKNHEVKEIASVEADVRLAHADAKRRIADAQTKKAAMVAEQRSLVAAQVAKAHGALEVQRARIEQVKLQLEADRIKGAEAQRGALIDQARGDAARILEDGKATARSLRELGKSWRAAGDDAARIMVAQKLSALTGHMMETAQGLSIDRVTVLDSEVSDGGLARKALASSEQLKQAVGVDVPALLRRLAPGKPSTQHG